MNETEQLRRAQAGDEAAWGQLVRQHQMAIFRLAYLLLRDADDAADVAQETFIRAYHALSRFDAARPLRPWLLAITRNQCSNWRRAWRRRLAALQRWQVSAADAGVGGALASPAAADPDEHLAQAWRATALWTAVSRLSQSDQEVIYLRTFLDLSVEESALALQVAPGTVKSRLSRALERLRRVVEQEFPALREEVSE